MALPPPGKFLLLFSLFTTFPSFIPFSDLVLLFPFPPQMLLLPPRSGRLLAAGDGEPRLRDGVGLAGRWAAAGWGTGVWGEGRWEPTVCCHVRTGPVSLLPSSLTCLFPRDGVGTKPLHVALGPSYTCLAQGWRGRRRRRWDGKCVLRWGLWATPLSRARRGLGSWDVVAACYLPPTSIRQNAEFSEGPSSRQAWPLLQAAIITNRPTEMEGRELFCLPLTKIVLSLTDTS